MLTRLLAFWCLLPVLAHAQPGRFNLWDQSFMSRVAIHAASGGSAFTPTNHDGSTAKSYFLADALSSSPVATWPDTSGGFNLTASGSAEPTLVTGGVNGHNYVSFDGVANYMKNTSYSCNQPHEIDMVCNMVSFGGSSAYYFDASGNTPRQAGYISSGSDKATAGSVVTITPNFPTNNWVVRSWVFSGSMLTVYTNGVAEAAAASCGSSVEVGLTVAAQYTLSASTLGHLWLAEMVTYATPQSAAGLSNLVYQWKGKYNITH
jgi:hypothetical protein